MAATVKDWKNTKDARLEELHRELNGLNDNKFPGIRRLVMSVRPSTTPFLPPTREERTKDSRWEEFKKQPALDSAISDSTQNPKYKLPIPPVIKQGTKGDFKFAYYWWSVDMRTAEEMKINKQNKEKHDKDPSSTKFEEEFPENMKLFEDQISVMLERAWWEWERHGWPLKPTPESDHPFRCYITAKWFVDFREINGSFLQKSMIWPEDKSYFRRVTRGL